MPSHERLDGDSAPGHDSMDDVIALYKKDVDVSLLRSRLRMTPEDRLLDLMRVQRLVEEMRRAGQAAKGRST